MFLVSVASACNQYTSASLRAVFLRLVSLGVLLFTLWSQITCSTAERGECQPCGYNHTLYPVLSATQCASAFLYSAHISVYIRSAQRHSEDITSVAPCC